ncbi:hypothetical protein HYT26_04210 [Candidatus Pacearchaeota archaeon]|nr:hypothetical protein [Candidatus Pacearchaeota archaeon]
MKVQHLKLILSGLTIALLAILLDSIAHKLIFEPAYPTFLPEVFSYFAAKFLVIFITYILFMYIFAYSKSKFILSGLLRPVVIAFVAMLLFAAYYYFYPSNTNPAALPSSFFPFMGFNHFLDILIAALLAEFLIKKLKRNPKKQNKGKK